MPIDCEAIVLQNLRIQTRGRNLSKLQPYEMLIRTTSNAHDIADVHYLSFLMLFLKFPTFQFA